MTKFIPFILFMLFCCFIWSLCSCTKQPDYSYLNTDRRNCKTFVRVSKRFDINWNYLTSIKGEPEAACDSAIIWLKAYRDTLIWHVETCPPPVASMPEFRIEVRYYEEVKNK